MCGIAGLITDGDKRIAQTLKAMVDTLSHRGPDAEGTRLFCDGGTTVGLGHRRLSIIDLAGGLQPMCNEDETIWITYNGEIYNHEELRSELISRGHKYRTKSDTETIVHAFEEWGPNCVHRLRGMFAFAIWNVRDRELFAARDRMGIKPFYYSHDLTTGQFAFASEIKSLVSSGVVSPELALGSLPEQMTFGYLSGNQTLFQGICKLLPGELLHFKHGRLKLKQYWDIPRPDEKQPFRPVSEYVAEFTELFRESVKIRMMSDVPLGVFLSGGLDSSAIASAMAQEVSGQLKTFSVGYESQYFSEFDFAREVSRHIGSEHHEVVLTPEAFFRSLPFLAWHEDEPIRSSPSVALFHVAQLAKQHVTVVQTGEGSDELFAGYDRYWATLFNLRWGKFYYRCIPKKVREEWVRNTLWKWPLPLAVKKKISHTFFNHSQRPEEIVFDNFYSIFPKRVHESLFTPRLFEMLEDVDPYRESVRLYESRDTEELDRLLYTDQKTYLVELLRKQDSMSMAASIESRVPFLDHRIVEFAASVPAHLKLDGYSGKRLVKLVAKSLLPESILDRKKTGFPVPFSEWLRNGYSKIVKRILLSNQIRDRNLISGDFIIQILREHESGVRDHAEAIWTILSFEIWARVFLDGDDPSLVSDEMLGNQAGILV